MKDPNPKRRRLARKGLATAAVCGLFVLGWAMLSDPQPVHQGKSLSAWLADYEGFIVNKSDPDREEEARRAIRAIGTNAVPFLLEWMTTGESKALFKIKMKVAQWTARHANFPWQPTFALDRQFRSTRALNDLGPEAIPSLMGLSEHPQYGGRALYSLGNYKNNTETVGPFLIRHLIARTSEMDRIQICKALQLLDPKKAAAKPDLEDDLIQGLIGIVDNRSASLQLWTAAASVLDKLGPRASEAAPHIAEAILRASNLSPKNAFQVLDSVGAGSLELECAYKRIMAEGGEELRRFTQERWRKSGNDG